MRNDGIAVMEHSCFLLKKMKVFLCITLILLSTLYIHVQGQCTLQGNGVFADLTTLSQPAFVF